MGGSTLTLNRSHVIGVLVANAILWVAAILLSGKTPMLGGLAAIGLISIGTLLRRSRAA
jgi:hypothetical protein